MDLFGNSHAVMLQNNFVMSKSLFTDVVVVVVVVLTSCANSVDLWK
jgi:hypothetical protein